MPPFSAGQSDQSESPNLKICRVLEGFHMTFPVVDLHSETSFSVPGHSLLPTENLEIQQHKITIEAAIFPAMAVAGVREVWRTWNDNIAGGNYQSAIRHAP